jgi:H+/gluconate symporter-like permease
MGYQLAVLLAGFGLLTVLVMRGRSIFVVAPLCASLILLLSGEDPLSGMTGPFMEGFAQYIREFFLIFVLGAAFGKLLDDSGGAVAIAQGVGRGLGPRWACLSVVLACAVLTYGGVSLFVVGFSVYPLAIALFREGNVPRRFIPGAIAFGSVTFTMTSAGSPEIQNLIPIKFLVETTAEGTTRPLTDAMAGWPASVIVAVVMFLLGQVYLEWAIARDRARGREFRARPSDPLLVADTSQATNRPTMWHAIAPLVVTLLTLNAVPKLCRAMAGSTEGDAGTWREWLGRFPEDPTLAIFVGVLAAMVFLARWLPSYWGPISVGFQNGLIAIGATASVVGFGKAIRPLPAFERIVDWVTNLPGDPLIGAAVAVAVIAGLAGSASGGQGIALPIVKPIFIDQLGVAPRALHRVVAIASGSLDSLPANGYIVTLIHNVCGETHREAYMPIFVTTVLVPMVGTALAIWLFETFPSWALM